MAEYVELYIDQGTDFSTTIIINDDNTNLPTNTASSEPLLKIELV